MTETVDIVFTANSPGELWAQIKPTVEKIPSLIPNARIILVIPPCQYASGREAETSRQIANIYEVILPEEYKNWILKNQIPHGIKFNKKGIVVFMGGDLMHAMLISKKLNFPSIAYCRDHFTWKNHFKMFLVPDEQTYNKAKKTGLANDKIKIAGNLIADSISLTMTKEKAKAYWHLDESAPIFGFMLGSRPFQYQNMASFYIKTAEDIKKDIPNAQFVMPVSNFTSIGAIEKYINPTDRIYKEEPNSHCSIRKDGGKYFIQTEAGVKILMINELTYDAINTCDIILTLPGTNTAEIGAIGIPMISILPLNKPDVLPLEGIVETFSRIPVIGSQIKLLAIKILNKMVKYFALPNIAAGYELIPEIRGIIEPSEVAKAATDLLGNKQKRDDISIRLKQLMGIRGTSEKVIEEIKRILG